MARKRITVALDADVEQYLRWQAEVADSHIPSRVNALLRYTMHQELSRPDVRAAFTKYQESEQRAKMFVPLDAAAQS